MSNLRYSEIFSASLRSGKSVTAWVEVSLIIDRHYGSDADNKRGMVVLFIEDAKITSSILEDDNIPLTAIEIIEATTKLLEAADRHNWDIAV